VKSSVFSQNADSNELKDGFRIARLGTNVPVSRTWEIVRKGAWCEGAKTNIGVTREEEEENAERLKY
jgi:hypothetical protein